MTAFYVILGIVIALIVIVNIFLSIEGNAKVEVRTENRTPWIVEQQTDTSVVLSTKLEFANVGKQCATIMDAIVRPQLPYEQYDGIEVRGKAEMEGAPREDDYFEAVLIQKSESIFIHTKVMLTARKGMKLREALSHMVDLPVELIYMTVDRKPWRYEKVRFLLTADEIARLAGVDLAED